MLPWPTRSAAWTGRYCLLKLHFIPLFPFWAVIQLSFSSSSMPTLLQWYMLPVCLDSSLALCIPHFYSLCNLFKCLHLRRHPWAFYLQQTIWHTHTFNSVGFPLSFTRTQTSEKKHRSFCLCCSQQYLLALIKTCNYCLVLISWTLKFHKRGSMSILVHHYFPSVLHTAWHITICWYLLN